MFQFVGKFVCFRINLLQNTPYQLQKILLLKSSNPLKTNRFLKNRSKVIES
jgi:hypothetical protein